MKRILPLFLVAALVLGLSACNQEPSVKIGVVDEAAAFKDNKLATEAMAHLQEMGKPLQEKAEAAYKAMQADQTEETVAAYKLAMGELQNTMTAEQQRVVGLVDAKFNEVLDNYRKEKGLTLILSRQAIIASSETVDITKDIVAAMDKVQVDFTRPEAPKTDAPTPEAAPAPAEAPAKTAPEGGEATK
ncbi:OmpH family outer membrane protein [Pseudodesulfovibrio thermohalotolerans]|uniref:OmpH family outer membrane protein n=1 Tax=Pseudodesulfovibrio thermohalotolerans TaxID=2880651 RepID=UPI002442928C|nr:OmpH family outer membrane protein [Pseudodesulfovibrio thermohalotolerans]WFS62546.1 OmpH family outer membrane protein [Pseudodesulfovibrio thermohalotolerans]